MFNQITLTNYKTHQLTTITLNPITLLIGDNNSGKTNLLSGVQHFSSLVRRANPQFATTKAVVTAEDFFSHRYRRAKDNEGLSISVTWTNAIGKIRYDLELYAATPAAVGCRENISVSLTTTNTAKTIKSGYDTFTISLNYKPN